MARKRYTEERIIGVLQEAEVGTVVACQQRVVC